jgi:hypothetical protein
MLKNYDILFESLLKEGRKRDELKKFKFDLYSVKHLVDELDSSDEHKGHFKSIVSKLKPKDFYTPKTFKKAVSLIFKQLKKSEIADGYATIFYDWLKNHDESPLSDYDSDEGDETEDDFEDDSEHESQENREPISKETQEWINKNPKPFEEIKTSQDEKEEEVFFKRD